jgi:receptor protein-tyrosine kinase
LAGGPVEIGARGLMPMRLARLLTRANEDAVLVEEALRLAKRLEVLLDGGEVLVVSGSSSTPLLYDLISQLAGAFAMLGRAPVLLVDSDLEQPRLHRWHETQLSPGLGHVLMNSTDLAGALQPTAFPGVSLVAAGDIAGTQQPLLISERVAALFAQARREFKLTLVAAPPVLESSGTGVLASHADGVILAAVANRDELPAVVNAARTFEALQVRLLGSILCEAGR